MFLGSVLLGFLEVGWFLSENSCLWIEDDGLGEMCWWNGDGYCFFWVYVSLWIEKMGSEVGVKVENILCGCNGLRKKIKFFCFEVVGIMEVIVEGNFF